MASSRLFSISDSGRIPSATFAFGLNLIMGPEYCLSLFRGVRACRALLRLAPIWSQLFGSLRLGRAQARHAYFLHSGLNLNDGARVLS